MTKRRKGNAREDLAVKLAIVDALNKGVTEAQLGQVVKAELSRRADDPGDEDREEWQARQKELADEPLDLSNLGTVLTAMHKVVTEKNTEQSNALHGSVQAYQASIEAPRVFRLVPDETLVVGDIIREGDKESKILKIEPFDGTPDGGEPARHITTTDGQFTAVAGTQSYRLEPPPFMAPISDPRIQAYQKVNAGIAKAAQQANERIKQALDRAMATAQIDGAHHKAWTLDQMVRALTGDGYDEWIRLYKEGEDGPETYEWDVGIAP
jgi:hypothetical protein